MAVGGGCRHQIVDCQSGPLAGGGAVGRLNVVHVVQFGLGANQKAVGSEWRQLWHSSEVLERRPDLA